jgi:catechol 2,3-dioxygenase-like lactoylglutathione lyase family enzyme
METIISKLLSSYEKGLLSRRELVSGLAMLAAGTPAAAAAQDEIEFKDANIDHVSIKVTDLERSIAFYQKMFGFSVVSRADPDIIRLGNGKILVSINLGSPARTIDHFSIGIPRFNAASAARYFTQRGAMPLQGDYAGFHIKDPDGINVQISQR